MYICGHLNEPPRCIEYGICTFVTTNTRNGAAVYANRQHAPSASRRRRASRLLHILRRQELKIIGRPAAQSDEMPGPRVRVGSGSSVAVAESGRFHTDDRHVPSERIEACLESQHVVQVRLPVVRVLSPKDDQGTKRPKEDPIGAAVAGPDIDVHL